MYQKVVSLIFPMVSTGGKELSLIFCQNFSTVPYWVSLNRKKACSKRSSYLNTYYVYVTYYFVCQKCRPSHDRPSFTSLITIGHPEATTGPQKEEPQPQLFLSLCFCFGSFLSLQYASNNISKWAKFHAKNRQSWYMHFKNSQKLEKFRHG